MAQQPDSFDPEQVLAQLRYAGMLETVRVRRSGYPVRVPHEDFAKRFGLLLTGQQQKLPSKALCERILQSIRPPANMGAGTHWQVGVSKVFLRDYMGAALEDLRNARLVKQVIAIQSWWRMIVLRLFYLHARGAAICIQSNLRRFLLRKAFRRLREAVLTAQAVMRMLQVRKSFAIKVPR
jgi:myosin heavy subunit